MKTDKLSSWEETKKRSTYHFDPSLIDPYYDTVDRVGQIDVSGITQAELDTAAEESYQATWRTRGNTLKHTLIGIKSRPEEELQSEDYDLVQTGYGTDHIISNINWHIPKSVQAIADQFKLVRQMTRLHVQHPGQVWNLHMDKLEKWNQDDPSLVERYMIQLTDWKPGQWMGYGNYTFEHWKAGDVTSFKWRDIPHSTANAGHHPRITLQVTGVRTEKSKDFQKKLRRE